MINLITLLLILNLVSKFKTRRFCHKIYKMAKEKESQKTR